MIWSSNKIPNVGVKGNGGGNRLLVTEMKEDQQEQIEM